MTKPKQRSPAFKDFVQELKNSAITVAKPVSIINERKYFLIVSEGERTEPLYFKYFRNFLPRNLLETVEVVGEGDNTINIVQKAIDLREERRKEVLKPDYDQVWAVFDKDDFPSKRFNRAVELAENNNIFSGHSNQSFELWYVLHFQYLQTALHRSDYIDILSGDLGFKYEKNEPKVVEFLFNNCNIKRAINWAKRLETMHKGLTPSKSCPYTKVYKLVEELRKYVKHDV